MKKHMWGLSLAIFAVLLCTLVIKKTHIAEQSLAMLKGAETEEYEEKENEERENGESEEDEEREESGVVGQMMSWFHSRAYPDANYLDQKYMNGWLQAEALRKQQANTRGANAQSGGMWTSIGPTNLIGGRILSIAVDPTSNQKLFAGSASGGMWKSVNGGSSWSHMTMGLPVLGVTSILIHPTKPAIMYAGTGEVYRVDSTGTTPNPGNTGGNVWKARGTYGIGILKSINGGATWTQVLTRTTPQLFGIQALRFDPSNANTIYACATDGLYRSTNSGATWTQLFAVTYVSDVVVNGTNIVIAVGNLGNTVKGIYKSTNSGTTWSLATGIPAFQGFIKMDWVASDPTTIIASVGISKTSTTELWKSTNFGTSFISLPTSGHTSYQYWSAHAVAINPSNVNRIAYAGVSTYEYTLPSTSITLGSGVIHSDVHAIEYDPTNNNILYVCCDGGIYKSTNANGAGTPTFTRINNGLEATQFYASVGVSATDPDLYIGGLQDNGSVIYDGTSWNTLSWVGGDGAAAAIDPSNDQNMLANRDARDINRSTDGGATGGGAATYWGSVADSRTAFVAPMTFAPSNSTIAYCATDNLHKSTNGGGTWTFNAFSSATNYIQSLHKTALALAVSPTNPNKVYVSLSSFAQFDNDADGLFYTGVPTVLKTLTGATPFTQIMGAGATAIADRYIMDFAISPTFDDSVFVAVGGFGTSHVYVTGNGGTSWAARGTGLPDVPFNAVLIDKVDPRILYAGGDAGVWVSTNRGATWADYSNGFWDGTQIMDIQMTADSRLVAATHGKGMFISPRYAGALPVNIISFTGEALPASNKLQWITGQEINLSHYELERSTNGNAFTPVKSISATNAGTYNYYDDISNNQTYFYRLKTVNTDNSYKYSEVIQIKRTGENIFQVLTNPFNTSIQLRFSVTQNTKAQINLYDGIGRLMKHEQATVLSGQSNYTVENLNPLPAGIYYLETVINNQRWKQKMIKK